MKEIVNKLCSINSEIINKWKSYKSKSDKEEDVLRRVTNNSLDRLMESIFWLSQASEIIDGDKNKPMIICKESIQSEVDQSDWTLHNAKIVLDELQSRFKLLSELERILFSDKADEVHELQPLFHRGLWIFGPEYETIEFTSNNGMTKIIQELFGKEISGSKKRPDFAILPDSTVGLYSYPFYDEEGNEIGTDKLTIVELKAPGVRAGTKEKNQCWNYVKELFDKGCLERRKSRVDCFIVADSIEDNENSLRTEMEETVRIRTMNYTIIKHAKSRLHKLYNRIKDKESIQFE